MYCDELKKVIGMTVSHGAQFDSVLEPIGVFLREEILPRAAGIDQEGLYPRENLRKLLAPGIPSLPFPKEIGGQGLPYPVYIAALEMLATACANTALQVSIQGMVCEGILHHGNHYQKALFLEQNGLVQGSSLAAFALTEPCCGSDAQAIETRAAPSAGYYSITGVKTLITSPGEADFILLFARTGAGISVFIVPRNASGFRVQRVLPKLGFKGHRLSEIHFENCRVAADYLVGEDGKGLEYAKHMLNSGRISIAAIAVGIARAAYEKSLAYSRKRTAFGKKIGDFQLVQQKLADMYTEISAARLLTFFAAGLKDRGESVISEASRAKLFASEMALRVCDQAIQIHGGYGYTDEYDVHRHWRDARLLTIGEGTSDMLRLLIARQALKRSGGI